MGAGGSLGTFRPGTQLLPVLACVCGEFRGCGRAPLRNQTLAGRGSPALAGHEEAHRPELATYTVPGIRLVMAATAF